jgi:hypothetical protein
MERNSPTFLRQHRRRRSVDEGDFNADGWIDAYDLEILQQNWLLDADIASLSTNDFDVFPYFDSQTLLPQLSVRLNRKANLDGDRDVDGSDLKRILTWYGRNGFGDVDADGDTDGRDFLEWQRQYFEYNLKADFEVDAIVGSGDLDIWQTSYNANRGGDADGDGDSDGRDFLIWQRQFNAIIQDVLSGSFTVPEPHTVMLLLPFLMTLCINRTRRKI